MFHLVPSKPPLSPQHVIIIHIHTLPLSPPLIIFAIYCYLSTSLPQNGCFCCSWILYGLDIDYKTGTIVIQSIIKRLCSFSLSFSLSPFNWTCACSLMNKVSNILIDAQNSQVSPILCMHSAPCLLVNAHRRKSNPWKGGWLGSKHPFTCFHFEWGPTCQEHSWN